MPGATSAELRAEYGDLSAADVGRLDAAAMELGLDTERLMEHAGWQVARCAGLAHGMDPCSVAVISGSGNNGGDGVVAGRLLSTWGFDVRLMVFADARGLKDAFLARVEVARRCGVDVVITRDVSQIRHGLEQSALAIDALLGSGLSGPPREETRPAITALSDHPMTLAVDVPSGLDPTTGAADFCVRAQATCTLAAMKSGLWSAAGRTAAGRIYVADIGMPREAWTACRLQRPSAVTHGVIAELARAE